VSVTIIAELHGSQAKKRYRFYPPVCIGTVSFFDTRPLTVRDVARGVVTGLGAILLCAGGAFFLASAFLQRDEEERSTSGLVGAGCIVALLLLAAVKSGMRVRRVTSDKTLPPHLKSQYDTLLLVAHTADRHLHIQRLHQRPVSKFKGLGVELLRDYFKEALAYITYVSAPGTSVHAPGVVSMFSIRHSLQRDARLGDWCREALEPAPRRRVAAEQTRAAVSVGQVVPLAPIPEGLEPLEVQGGGCGLALN
jgi:hypothetical protein